MNYWNQKEMLAKQATAHTKEMEEKYAQEIEACFASSRVFSDNTSIKSGGETYDAEHEVIKTDCVDAIFRQPKEANIVVLNFASYKNPGGMFWNGSSAQEESLCHASFLYNVLRKGASYYKWNNEHKNKALYLNRAIYSPNVRFFNDGETRLVDVITCAAPNKTAYFKYMKGANEKDCVEALKSRIVFIRNVLQSMSTKGVKNDVLVFGAYGCGVFGQNPEDVARICHEVFRESPIQRIIHPIPTDKNLKEFINEFGEVKEKE